MLEFLGSVSAESKGFAGEWQPGWIFWIAVAAARQVTYGVNSESEKH